MGEEAGAEGGSVELEKGVTPSHKAQARGIQQAPLEMRWGGGQGTFCALGAPIAQSEPSG